MEERIQKNLEERMKKFSHLKSDDPLRTQIEGMLCSCGGAKFRGEVMCSLCYWKMEWADDDPDLPEEEDG